MNSLKNLEKNNISMKIGTKKFSLTFTSKYLMKRSFQGCPKL